jgi:transcription initiation factor TFIIIB Brf1 subunit/transcription initiation factor TFIIB
VICLIGGEVGSIDQGSCGLGKEQDANEKLAKQYPLFLHQPPKQPQILCPQCHSRRLYKGGHRYLSDGTDVQRWLCRECGYRFSEKPLQIKQEWSINNPDPFPSKRRICAKKAKNLTNATEAKTVAGESSLQDAKGKIVEFSFWLLKQGYSQATIKGRVKLLSRMMRLGANFGNEESVKEVIAQQIWSVSRKVNAVDAYD